MKHFVKSILRSICVILVFPSVVAYRLQATFTGADKAMTGWSQLFSLFPGMIGVYLRHAFYRCSLSDCGLDASIGFGTVFSHSDTTIGRTAYIGSFCSIGNVAIGKDVLIASHVSIMNGCHQHSINRLDIPVREQPGTFDDVAIGEDTWIGEKAIVAASVGKHCVIGAGALVMSSIPDYAVAVGVPARVIGDRRELSEGTPEFDAVQTPEPQKSRGNLSDSHLVSVVGDTRR